MLTLTCVLANMHANVSNVNKNSVYCLIQPQTLLNLYFSFTFKVQTRKGQESCCWQEHSSIHCHP